MKKQFAKHRIALFTANLVIPVAVVAFAFVWQRASGAALSWTSQSLPLVMLMITFLGGIITATMTLFAQMSQVQEDSVLNRCYWLGMELVLISGTELLRIAGFISPMTLLGLQTILNAMIAFGILEFNGEVSAQNRQTTYVVGISAALFIVLIAGMVPLSNRLITLDQAYFMMTIIREGVIFTLPFTRHFFSKALTPPNLVSESFARLLFAATAIYAGMMLFVFMTSKKALESTGVSGIQMLQASTLMWIPIATYVSRILLLRVHQQKDTSYIAQLPSIQAKRFLLRYAAVETPWAATMGMRTVNYLIDHDPQEASQSKLTSTLTQIRREEIERFFEPILKEKLLYRRSFGNQVFGTVDPEYSIRPCIDVLVLFCCIYLDAIPMIERRLKNLAALFPIIDPDIASAITPRAIEQAHAQMEWLFFFDYDWIDQQIIGNMKQLEYGVYFNKLPVQTRAQLVRHLQDKNRMGNYIWLGEQARNRIIMEAPYLVSIIETFQVQDEQNENFTIYLFRFEELIPRVQKYFNLEENRRNIRDYEMTDEGQKLINMLEVHITQADSVERILEVVGTIGSTQWHGFRERDSALRLVIAAYDKIHEMTFQTINAESKEQIRRKFHAAIDQIGYPGQLLYTAHNLKRSIRMSDRLARICSDPNHKRFVEGWLYLATMDVQKLRTEEAINYLGIISRALESKILRHNPLVLQKSVEGFFNLGRAFKDQAVNSKHLEFMVNQILANMLHAKAGVELCCFFIDAKINLDEVLQRTIPIDQKLMDAFNEYLNAFVKKYGNRSSITSALISRQRMLHFKCETNAPSGGTTPKAS